MSEEKAKERLRKDIGVPRETMEKLEKFVELLISETQRQNLVSRGTLDSVWNRHILDSAQLLRFATSPTAAWLDLGTGAGFPGLIIALLHEGPVTLAEERKKRVDFLREAATLLGIKNSVTFITGKVERAESRPFDVISARAFAPLGRLFELSHSFSTTKTRFILPKGRNARSELAAVESSWQGDFRLEPSLTDPEAGIIIAEGVRRKAGGKGAR